MLKDKFLIGAVIGILADALKLLTNYILYVFGFTKVVFWQIVATLFIQKEQLYHKLAYLVGAIADLTVTSLMGIVFVYVIYLLVFGTLPTCKRGSLTIRSMISTSKVTPLALPTG